MRSTVHRFNIFFVGIACLITVGCTAVPPTITNTPAKDPSALSTDISASCAAEADRQPCLEKAVVQIVETEGPEFSMKVLLLLLEQDSNLEKKDYHDLVHRIGRQTAKTYGITTDAFFRCPTDFNYGCQHGFFEQALVTEPDARTAALKICNPDLMRDKPGKYLFYCFHGVGHGIMMARAYRLLPSLELCDTFPETQMQQGCWQGVFMENVNGAMAGTAQENAFSETDVLAPCSVLPEKYRWECYINHAGYLVPKTQTVEAATTACLQEPTDARNACLQSIGLMATNPGWQQGLAPGNGSLTEKAVDICLRFPKGFEQHCVIGAIDNLANFDQADTTRLLDFCGLLPQDWKELCYTRIGLSVKNELPPAAPKSDACAGVPEEYLSSCLEATQS
ncbi:MAG TPA: hypothetical protein VI873_01010 [Candidatus Peribacteraceae bacterium]|nr:hypothetical protein [Candidatus Peribacteraceae bacterium]